ncbi:MAG TPA: efflux RND transporter periplasmic adaptor subunit [Casimicrobiaceae bacterium]|jgi:RND family efflux transporter MFP subunit|nr:efflux RND transporter periplasmic adaptor subunit [Casimicrobiaceae bacterium]
MAARFTRRRTLWVLAVTLVLGALAGSMALRASKSGSEAHGDAPVALEFAAADLAHVEPQPLTRWLPLSGTLQPLNQTTVKAKVSGEIRQVTVREGEAVKAGQVLVRFDTADLEARLTDRIGALESSRAQLGLAEKTRAQNQLLLKQNFISQNAYDSAESNLSVSQGTLKSNEAQAQMARIALNYAVVTAPLSGMVAKRHVQPGEKVSLDAPLITIVDLEQMELQAMVPANDVPELATGMKVDLSIDGFGERHFTGTIERINPTTEAGTRAILVFIHIPNPDAALRGGMFGTGKVTLAAGAPVPTLPAVSVRTEAGQSFVWTIEDGKLTRRLVTVGRRDPTTGRVEIKTALDPSIPILAAPFDNLKPGAPALVRASNLPNLPRSVGAS